MIVLLIAMSLGFRYDWVGIDQPWCKAPIYIDSWEDTPNNRLYMYSIAGKDSCFAKRWDYRYGIETVGEPDWLLRADSFTLLKGR